MSIKRNMSIFLSVMLFPISLSAGINDVVAWLLTNLSNMQPEPPFFESFGILYYAFFGSLTSTIFLRWLLQICMFLGISIIETYVVHRLLRVSYAKALLRMLCVNILSSYVTKIFFHTILSKIDEAFGSFFYNQFFFTSIVLISVFLFLRIIPAFMVYLWFDPSVNKKRLFKVMTCAIVLSTIFLIIMYTLQYREVIGRLWNISDLELERMELERLRIISNNNL